MGVKRVELGERQRDRLVYPLIYFLGAIGVMPGPAGVFEFA